MTENGRNNNNRVSKSLARNREKGILILDGAMGTMLQKKGFSGNFDMLNLTHPDAVKDVYMQYLE
ncbi:MAG: homocysteine S-methyltransferase family protein, partial [Bacteroidaceae bacterium]|nr:homocysteine S-methyltransferase family protein [Bacteroidaceae bacterium]